MTFRAAPGGILAASEVLAEPRQAYTREQVAYLIKLAYTTGKLHGLGMALADTTGPFVPDETPTQTRTRMVAQRLAEYGPVRYRGGPVDWETGRSLT